MVKCRKYFLVFVVSIIFLCFFGVTYSMEQEGEFGEYVIYTKSSTFTLVDEDTLEVETNYSFAYFQVNATGEIISPLKKICSDSIKTDKSIQITEAKLNNLDVDYSIKKSELNPEYLYVELKEYNISKENNVKIVYRVDVVPVRRGMIEVDFGLFNPKIVGYSEEEMKILEYYIACSKLDNWFPTLPWKGYYKNKCVKSYSTDEYNNSLSDFIIIEQPIRFQIQYLSDITEAKQIITLNDKQEIELRHEIGYILPDYDESSAIQDRLPLNFGNVKPANLKVEIKVEGQWKEAYYCETTTQYEEGKKRDEAIIYALEPEGANEYTHVVFYCNYPKLYRHDLRVTLRNPDIGLKKTWPYTYEFEYTPIYSIANPSEKLIINFRIHQNYVAKSNSTYIFSETKEGEYNSIEIKINPEDYKSPIKIEYYYKFRNWLIVFGIINLGISIYILNKLKKATKKEINKIIIVLVFYIPICIAIVSFHSKQLFSLIFYNGVAYLVIPFIKAIKKY